MPLLQDLPVASTRYPRRTPLGSDFWKSVQTPLVGAVYMNEFDEEEPTQPEIAESLETLMERLRDETSRRPTVRLKPLLPTETP